MEAASTSETSVNFYPTSRRKNPEDSRLDSVCSEYGPLTGFWEPSNENLGSKKGREFLSSWATISFWRRTLCFRLSQSCTLNVTDSTLQIITDGCKLSVQYAPKGCKQMGSATSFAPAYNLCSVLYNACTISLYIELRCHNSNNMF
jgi:hypothetical protein